MTSSTPGYPPGILEQQHTPLGRTCDADEMVHAGLAEQGESLAGHQSDHEVVYPVGVLACTEHDSAPGCSCCCEQHKGHLCTSAAVNMKPCTILGRAWP